MPILRRRPKEQGPDNPVAPSPQSFRPSAPLVENEDGYADGTERDGISAGMVEESPRVTESLKRGS